MTKTQLVIPFLEAGWRNKDIAEHLGISRGVIGTIKARHFGYVKPKILARQQLAKERELERQSLMRKTPDRIKLTRGKTTLISPEDLESLIHIRWQAHLEVRRWYATGYPGKKMHRVILDAQEGDVVDHVNGDGLDNRRENLRLCTQRENSVNSARDAGVSSYRGVWKNGDNWCAVLAYKGNRIYLGQHESAEIAAKAWDAAAIKLNGDFARLNFPPASRWPS